MIRFFVVGTGRCGTNLLRNILNLHPDVYVPTESHWIPIQYDFYGRLRNPLEAYVDIMQRTFYHTGQVTFNYMAEDLHVSPADLLQLLGKELRDTVPDIVEFNDHLYGVLAATAGRSIAGDKTPDYGPYLTILQSLWPQAKFVHMIRDGRDVALSMSKHGGYQRLLSSRNHSWVSLAFDKRYQLIHAPDDSHPLEAYIRLWDLRVRRTLAEANNLARGSYLEVRYEDLLGDPLADLTRLTSFLQLAPNADWLTRSVETIHPDNTNKVVDSGTFRSLTAVARDTLAALGYDTQDRT